jgi:crotonobetainyl-CoA:carnitine CoA-transferase CaiB-like acyl-CoA transferase
MDRPELAEDPRFKDHLTRLKEENATPLLKIIAAWVRTKRSEEVEELGERHGFAASRVYDSRHVVEDAHFRERGFITDIDDPFVGPFTEYEFPVMMSKSTPKVKWSLRAVGFDNEYIMKRILGKSEDEIKELYRCGALGKWADMQGCRPPPEWDGKAGVIMPRD